MEAPRGIEPRYTDLQFGGESPLPSAPQGVAIGAGDDHDGDLAVKRPEADARWLAAALLAAAETAPDPLPLIAAARALFGAAPPDRQR